MKRILATLAATAFLAFSFASTAGAAEQNPAKFGPHDTQCVGDNNQPNCPGSH
jgi:hypothetical protein